MRVRWKYIEEKRHRFFFFPKQGEELAKHGGKIVSHVLATRLQTSLRNGGDSAAIERQRGG